MAIAARPRDERTTEVPGGRVNILIVDDRPQNLLALRAALDPLGQHVLQAGSGEEALRCLLKHDVAVIILDVQMPNLDGFETAAYIKSLDRTRHIPIIFLTAINKEARHVFRGYSAGAVDYLFKPFDPTVLRSKVAVFIDLHQKSNELRASEERFRRAFEHAPIGVALVSPSGSLIKVNKALEKMSGLTQAELVATTIHDLLQAEDPPLHLDKLVRDAPSGSASWHGECRLSTRDGSQRFALVATSLISHAGGEASHFIFQIADITERRELESFRERFVSHAAHELRTPATVIAGTASLLRDNRDDMDPTEVDQCVSALYRQSQRLTSMVANLLDLARLKEGRLTTKPEPIDLPTAVATVVEATPPPSGRSVETDIDAGTKAFADPEAFDQIVSNLLVNAYRYGGPHVTISAAGDGPNVTVTVRDDGAGVPSDLVAHLFEPFTRGKASSKVGGSGLGLALVKSLAEASGGDISYEGDPAAGGGAAFVLRLPATR